MKPMPTPNEVSATARRRLLRGAFAIPVVATVHSGAALASSSNLRCLGNSTAVPGVVSTGSTENPIYLRVELGVSTKGGGSGLQTKYYVDGSSVVARATQLHVSVSTLFISTGKFLPFGSGANLSSNMVTGTAITDPAANGFNYLKTSGKFAVLMFSADGKTILGVGATSGANAATQSCWGSFAA